MRISLFCSLEQKTMSHTPCIFSEIFAFAQNFVFRFSLYSWESIIFTFHILDLKFIFFLNFEGLPLFFQGKFLCFFFMLSMSFLPHLL